MKKPSNESARATLAIRPAGFLTEISASVLLLACACTAAIPALADTEFKPSVAASGLYVDNIFLVPPGIATKSDEVAELMPRLQVTTFGPRLTGALDYSAQGLAFRDNSNLDAVHNSGTANGAWTAYPDWLFIEGRASYLQQTVDPTEPSNPNNLFAVGNVTNVFNALVSPYVKHDFDALSGTLRYAESVTSYSGGRNGLYGSLLQNSHTGIASGKLYATETDAPFAWSVDGRDARTHFASAEPFVDDRLALNASVRALPSLRLTATAGAETNLLTNSAAGGFDAGFWSVGFKWSPNAKTIMTASAGHRFFGPAYALEWSQEGRLLKLKVTYSDEVTDAGQSDATTDFVPGVITTSPQAYNGVLRSISTYDPYHAKAFNALIEISGHLTTLSLSVYVLHRSYLDPPTQGDTAFVAGGGAGGAFPEGGPTFVGANVILGNRDATRGGELKFTRTLGPRNSVRLSAKLDQADEVSGFTYRDHRYEFQFIHNLSRTLDLEFKAVRLLRSGTAEYRADIGQVTLRKLF